MLAAAPLLAAFGAPLGVKRGPDRPMLWGDWSVFPGRAGIRGPLPPAMQSDGPLLRALLQSLRQIVVDWPQPRRWELRSIYVMATVGSEGAEVQAAINGFVDAALIAKLSELAWPRPAETFLYKQLFVLRGGKDE
jgi:hypothetical protein